jgi:hypothetical protein
LGGVAPKVTFALLQNNRVSTLGTLSLLEFRVRKTFAADVANLRGFSRKIGENPRNLRQKGTWASQAKINSKLKSLFRATFGCSDISRN